jgi:hypothetical protein
MSRREKILLAATAVVAVLGLVTLLGGKTPSVTPPSRPAAGEAAKAAAMLKTIQDAAMGPHEVAVLAAIDRKWREAAFYDRSLAGREVVKPAVLPRYTGYVELGTGRLAVLDGMEYQAGDPLDGGVYKVFSITPDQVVLENMGSGQRVTVQAEGQDSR